MKPNKDSDALRAIPDPAIVRSQLQQNLADRRILRKLLDIAERKAGNLRQRQDQSR